MSELQINLQAILTDKNTNLLPENLKAGVTCLGVEGIYDGEIKRYTSIEEMEAESVNNDKTTYGIIYSYSETNWQWETQAQTIKLASYIRKGPYLGDHFYLAYTDDEQICLAYTSDATYAKVEGTLRSGKKLSILWSGHNYTMTSISSATLDGEPLSFSSEGIVLDLEAPVKLSSINQSYWEECYNLQESLKAVEESFDGFYMRNAGSTNWDRIDVVTPSETISEKVIRLKCLPEITYDGTYFYQGTLYYIPLPNSEGLSIQEVAILQNETECKLYITPTLGFDMVEQTAGVITMSANEVIEYHLEKNGVVQTTLPKVSNITAKTLNDLNDYEWIQDAYYMNADGYPQFENKTITVSDTVKFYTNSGITTIDPDSAIYNEEVYTHNYLPMGYYAIEGSVNSQKYAEGTKTLYSRTDIAEVTASTQLSLVDEGVHVKMLKGLSGIYNTGAKILISNELLATVIGLTSDKIKAGETILGVMGTYSGETS